MQQSIDEIRQQFLQALALIKTTSDLEAVKVKFLGKKGPLQQLMKGLKDVAPEDRPAVGKHINDLKELMTTECDQLEAKLIAQEESQQLAHETLDITLPGRKRFIGRKHPLTQAMDQIIAILVGMGFSVQYGPDIDSDYYNFEVLNFPLEHPARDMQDTFYISPHILLRTHTSNIQARVMEANEPPIRIIAPGKVYRNETITARSHVFFHQIEAVYIDKHVAFSDLMAAMDEFLKKLFKQDIATRYRPSYFPFVEPGMEVDISCLVCKGAGCHICKYSGWVEVAGAGMIHPQVLRNGGIDPESYSGFAWGMGLERLVMMLKGIQDIRLFTENDLRFLEQFTAI
ncbi:phenylalanine--tRNA ligase subunit alpha [Candidatus Protochlamydia phocaeensis]|uniref:phenylalanine--tRNA ligase subunit alpha n=1 Tax=Candidatus Protochlamydia phocaeensis TaxID=1414722 RepID=UPI0008388DEE|nr:phenylalanine--tRNA ligase subunit alpha [Candidatus Protochlamydia phocaeensis]